MKLSQPQAYGEIKPLHGRTGRPIRCTASHVVTQSAETEDRLDCANCQARRCRVGTCDRAEESPAMTHAWYYDLTADHRHSGDPESLLVWLCDDCANCLAAEVQFAGSDGFCDVACWQCGTPIEPKERTRR